MAEYDLFSEADFEQVPCEFCDELFPFELLIQHSSGCRPDIAHYNYDQAVDNDVEMKVPKMPPPPFAQLEKNNAQKTETKETDLLDLVTVAKESIKEALKVKDEKQKSPPTKDFGKLSLEDPATQETGTKLMTYGSNKSKPVEKEKPSFKVPSIALLNNANKKEANDECNVISDDEEGESLEDFWKRAEIFNYQRLKKIKEGHVC